MERSRSQPSMCHGDTDVVWTITKDNLNRIYITEFKVKNNFFFTPLPTQKKLIGSFIFVTTYF